MNFSLKNIKKAYGMEGEGLICEVVCGKQKIASYADHGDGGNGIAHFANKDAEKEFVDFARKHADEIFVSSYQDSTGFMEEMLNASKQALLTGETATYREGRTISFQYAVHEALEYWVSDQVNNAQYAKDCKKGVVIQYKGNSSEVVIYKNWAFTPENREKILAHEEKKNGIKKEDIVFINEKIGSVHTPLDVFNIECGPSLKNETSGKQIAFRDKAMSGQGLNTKWKAYSLAQFGGDMGRLRAAAAKTFPDGVEWRADLLKTMHEKACVATKANAAKPETKDSDLPSPTFP